MAHPRTWGGIGVGETFEFKGSIEECRQCLRTARVRNKRNYRIHQVDGKILVERLPGVYKLTPKKLGNTSHVAVTRQGKLVGTYIMSRRVTKEALEAAARSGDIIKYLATQGYLSANNMLRLELDPPTWYARTMPESSYFRSKRTT